jgi:hypothetical protein
MKRMLSIAVMAVALGIALIALWFSQQDPSEFAAWRAGPPQPSDRPAPPVFVPQPTPVRPPVVAEQPAPVAPPVETPPPPPTGRECKAMTCGVRGQSGLTTWVGAIDHSTNAYVGDTPCSDTRPLLCFQPGARPRPAAFSFPALVPQIGWTGGAIALLPEVLGLEIRSRTTADRMCAGKFGEGWRMAEFHDGGAWGFGAEGELPKDARFWVAINDQRANPWDH